MFAIICGREHDMVLTNQTTFKTVVFVGWVILVKDICTTALKVNIRLLSAINVEYTRRFTFSIINTHRNNKCCSLCGIPTDKGTITINLNTLLMSVRRMHPLPA